MNELNTLKFTTFTPAVAADPVTKRRNKLATKLLEQIAAAQAIVSGNTYTATRTRRVKTDLGVEMKTMPRRVRQWFHQIDDKRWAVTVFYGSRQLEFGKGRNAVEVANVTAVAAALETLRKAAVAGELDGQITSAADALKRRFNKK